MEPLGRLLGRLGGDPKEHKNISSKKTNIQIPIRSHHPDFRGGVWHPKIDQNRTQDESKFKTIFKIQKIALQEPLGAVLGRSWPHLGRSWGSKSCSRLGWRSFFEKSTFSKKSGLKARLGTILEPFGSPKGVVLGGQKGPKRHQKREQNDINILIDFLIDFGSNLV